MEQMSRPTREVHPPDVAGEEGRSDLHPAIHPSASFKLPGFGIRLFEAINLTSERAPHVYARWSNPTLRTLEQQMAALEGAEAGVGFATGMAAVSATLFTFLSSGDHIVASDVCYAGTMELLGHYLPRFGVMTSFVDTSDLLQVRKAIQNNTRLVYLETPANPTLRLGDISAIAKIAHAAGAKLVVDSTFATPILQTPLALGADLVIHSLTKYLNGHGDSLGGMVLGAEDLIHTIRKDMLVHLGGAMSPFNAWLVLRGLETLSLRMARHSQSAGKIAEYLENHRAIERVFYPGLASHPQHALAESQMANSGGMIAFRLKRGLAGAIDFAEKAQLLTYATSLGHPSSLFFFYPTDLYLREMDFLPEAQKTQIKWWMGDAGLLRLSVGLEDPDDLLEDISRALQSRTFKGLIGPLVYRLMQRG